MSDEMRRALEADGEKLRQLTGEDHGPWVFDPEVERILAMSDEEILAELTAEGGDAEAFAREIREFVESVIRGRGQPLPEPPQSA